MDPKKKRENVRQTIEEIEQLWLIKIKDFCNLSLHQNKLQDERKELQITYGQWTCMWNT